VLLLVAVVLTVEMTYKISVDSANGTVMRLFGVEFDAAGAGPWALAAGLWLVGGWLFHLAWRRFSHLWGTIQAEIAGARI
jgi:branched-chain amino acid transport system permease protein